MVEAMIKDWDSSVQVDVFLSGEMLLMHYKPYDAVFLDIDMNGINGIETGKKIRQIDKEVKIIYLTSYRDYVSGAFMVHAFQYLLKPVSKTVMCNVLKEIFRYTQNPEKKIILDFKTADGEYDSADKIGAVFKRMAAFGFSMPHQSFVINMLHVKSVRNQQIILDNNMCIPLSQKKQKAFKQELAKYLSGKLEERVNRWEA